MTSHYLNIPPQYCKQLGKLRWSTQADVVETEDGRTFVFTRELLPFLEGFVSVAPLIHFGHILHFHHLLRRRKPDRNDFTLLSMEWLEAGRPARSAGMICAMLCAEAPVAVNPPSVAELSRSLAAWGRTWVRPQLPGEEPSLDPAAFEDLVARELRGYTRAELRDWLRYAQPPAEKEGNSLADNLLAEKPRTLSEVLAEVSRHDRLTGAVPFVSHLAGALTLPPRRRDAPEMPMGGYADVTTRGKPEAILAGQFALDELEFVRRFAQNELLYYRREDPAVRSREDLVVLLDQGVRTWGSVRVLLAAAVFALGRMAQKRQLSLRLALTSSGGTSFDPVEVDPETLAHQLGQSDLSVSPRDALARLLQEKPTRPRDIVLLTHPLNRDDPATLEPYARTATAPGETVYGCRLFTLTTDRDGAVELSEVRHNTPVTISQFRVDPHAPAKANRTTRTDRAAWTGDLEPIPTPFLHGLAGRADPLLFGFDQAAQWLIAVNQPTTILALKTDGSTHEILPRPMLGGELLAGINHVIGVEGGFVLTGASHLTPVAAHYDFHTRTCRVIRFDLTGTPVRWRYLPEDHILAVIHGDVGRCVSLRKPGPDAPLPRHLHWPAPGSATSTRFPLPARKISSLDGGTAWLQPSIELRDGEIIPHHIAPTWPPFVPLEEGRPYLLDKTIERAELRTSTLAVLCGKNYGKQLCLFAGPGADTNGHLIGQLGLPYSHEKFSLSEDGRLLAVQRGQGQVQIREVNPGLTLRCVNPIGRFHNNLVAELSETCLRLSIGQMTHLIDWGSGILQCTLKRSPTATSGPHPNTPSDQPEVTIGASRPTTGPPARTANSPFVQVRSGGAVLPVIARDTNRFRACGRCGWLAAVMTYVGEVFLFGENDILLAGFFPFRDDLAVWMPDGTRHGSESLLGCPPTPNAARHIGETLLAAVQSPGRKRS